MEEVDDYNNKKYYHITFNLIEKATLWYKNRKYSKLTACKLCTLCVDTD